MLNLDKNKKYLLACSYGPDSMALFGILLKEKINFSVAHVNYHLREESIEETKGLKVICQKYKIKLFVHEVKEILEHNNLEEKCREIRYSFFKKIYDENEFDALLVAHQQDDNIETYIMQKRRNNMVKHYGIATFSTLFGMKVIRPLLDFSKEELQNYCLENGVPFAIDSSNLTNEFLRNKIRHEIVENMPLNERINILNEMIDDNKKIEEILAHISSLDLSSNKVLLSLSNIELAYAINQMAKEIDENAEISYSAVTEIQKVLKSDKPNVKVDFKDNLSFIKMYDQCEFVISNDIKDYSYTLSNPDELDTPYFYLNFKLNSDNRNVFNNDYPLTIRNAKLDDQYQINDYKVLVRRLFIDWKMPVSLRKRWPVIVNKNGEIIYIPRYRANFVIPENCNFYVK